MVSGIGFIGAGVILLHEEVVKGLTTAAALWFIAGVGLACGAGLLALAAVVTGLALLMLIVLRPIEHLFFPRRSAHRMRVRVERTAVEAGIAGTHLPGLRG